jgi:hypothetical protein
MEADVSLVFPRWLERGAAGLIHGMIAANNMIETRGSVRAFLKNFFTDFIIETFMAITT